MLKQLNCYKELLPLAWIFFFFLLLVEQEEKFLLYFAYK